MPIFNVLRIVVCNTMGRYLMSFSSNTVGASSVVSSAYPFGTKQFTSESIKFLMYF
jgi:hypothetical protein